MNNINAIVFKRVISGLFIMIILASCKKTRSLEVIHDGLQQIDVGNLNQSSPLDFENMIDHIRYIALINTSNKPIHVDKIIIVSGKICILDKTERTLQIYNQAGEVLNTINEVTAFNIYKGELYIYNMFKGEMRTYNSRVKLIYSKYIGFRGVDFANLNDSIYVFHTGGLVTKDKGSTGYEIAYIKKNGQFDKFSVKIAQDLQSINYITTNRFSFFKDRTYFIPSFGNRQYQLTQNQVSSCFEFYFGTITLTDSIFDKFKEVEDYNLFPYVLNVTNRFNTPQYSFYSCTFKGTEAYFVVDRHTSKVVISALAGLSGIRSEFNNTIPVAFFNNEYVSVIEKKEFADNQNFIKTIKKHKNAIIGSPNPLNGPVLMFYTIRDLSSYNDKVTNDHH